MPLWRSHVVTLRGKGWLTRQGLIELLNSSKILHLLFMYSAHISQILLLWNHIFLKCLNISQTSLFLYYLSEFNHLPCVQRFSGTGICSKTFPGFHFATSIYFLFPDQNLQPLLCRLLTFGFLHAYMSFLNSLTESGASTHPFCKYS